MITGETSSTPGRCSILGTSDCGMTALVKKKKTDELGDCTIRSAPTPSTRAPQSLRAPEVRPTIKRIRKTCKPMATALRAERTGWTPRLFQIIRAKINLGGCKLFFAAESGIFSEARAVFPAPDGAMRGGFMGGRRRFGLEGRPCRTVGRSSAVNFSTGADRRQKKSAYAIDSR